MSDAAVCVEGLGKRYRLGPPRQRYETLRDALAGAARRITRRRSREPERSFWALKDVSFEVRPGEVTGIVGRNGAGKSTLLKILSRITEPTTGSARLRGRVGSLLEVGTGFHPELTGRENIYLNGAMLGMRGPETARKFDEIVAFSEQEAFIDTPVKHYSSGMYMRLAFAVAAHLEPEILLVDEVLAVGDAAFQKKCLGKMGSIATEGRTILFVSHDMTNIATLCRTAILLDAGGVRAQGPVAQVVEAYLGEDTGDCRSMEWDAASAPGDAGVVIRALRVSRPQCGDPTGMFTTSDSIELAMEYEVRKGGVRLNPVFAVKNLRGLILFSTANYTDPEWGDREHDEGIFRTCCTIPANLLNDGTYPVDALLVHDMRTVRAQVQDALRFTVVDDGKTRGGYVGEWRGEVRPLCEWSTAGREVAGQASRRLNSVPPLAER